MLKIKALVIDIINIINNNYVYIGSFKYLKNLRILSR